MFYARFHTYFYVDFFIGLEFFLVLTLVQSRILNPI